MTPRQLATSNRLAFFLLQVRVMVLDKNDVAPTWGPGPWKFQISEEAPLNAVVTTLKAHDPDTIGNLTYTLVPNHPVNDEFVTDDNDNKTQSIFTLHPTTGQLRLAEALDRETEEKYMLKVRADDGLQHRDIVLHIQVKNLLRKIRTYFFFFFYKRTGTFYLLVIVMIDDISFSINRRLGKTKYTNPSVTETLSEARNLSKISFVAFEGRNLRSSRRGSRERAHAIVLRVSECLLRARGQVDNALDTSPCRKVADDFLL